MTTFKESGLNFGFSKSCWVVRKYDEHEYYQVLSGAGLKGMDFIAIWKKRRLVLMEAKNYRRTPASDLPPPAALVEEMHRKVEDTLTGMSAIHQMLERKSLYRLARPVLARLPLLSYDWPFWTRVAELSEFLDQTQVLLALEGYPEEYQPILLDALSRQLAGDIGTVEIIRAGQVAVEGLSITR